MAELCHTPVDSGMPVAVPWLARKQPFVRPQPEVSYRESCMCLR
jgi:hypothetical protein